MVLLAGLLLDPLELVERALARLVEQPPLEVLGQLDREDAVVARVVELDRRVPGRTRGLLVGGEQRVLERGRRSCPASIPFSRSISRTASTISWLIRHLPFVDQIGPHDRVVRYVERLAAPVLELERPLAGCDDLAAQPPVGGLDAHAAARPARSKVLAGAERPLEPRRGDLDRVPVEVGPEDAR